MPNFDELPAQITTSLDSRELIINSVVREVTIISGQNIIVGDLALLVRGPTGKYQELTGLAAIDGLSRPIAFLAHDADASGGDIITTVHIEGTVDENRIKLDGVLTLDSVLTGAPAGITIRDALRSQGFRFVNGITTDIAL